MKFIGYLLCALLRHPPSTWGKTPLEDEILRAMARPHPSPGHMLVAVSCVCGRKMVPFRARPL